MLNIYFNTKNHFKTQWKIIIKLCRHIMVDCFALCFTKVLGFFMFHNIVNNFIFFSVSVFSFFALFNFFCVAELSTFVTNVDYGCTIFPFFTFSFSSLCTIVNCTQMFSPFSAPMFKTLTSASMLARKFNLSLNFSSLQSNLTQP